MPQRPTARFKIAKLEDRGFRMSVGGDKREITPEADGLFEVESAPFKLRFVRDEKGTVTHFQMLVNGEEVQRGTKVK